MGEVMDRIAIDPEVVSGKPVIKGTRIPVYLVIELLASGITEKEILEQYPTLSKEDIKAALLYASKCVQNEETIIIWEGIDRLLVKILLDENIPKDISKWFIKKGFETTNVSQTHLKSAKDHAIAEYAAQNRMVIITLDKGFAQLYRSFQKGTLSVIIIKAHPSTPANIIETLNLAQNKINLKETQNKLVILTNKKIRIIS
jgi:uncharacterized protein (DUF433 family)/predicted nuclease of predicted toxin-antitoxin system